MQQGNMKAYKYLFNPDKIVIYHTNRSSKDDMGFFSPNAHLFSMRKDYHFLVRINGDIDEGLGVYESAPTKDEGDEAWLKILYCGGYIGEGRSGNTLNEEQKDGLYHLLAELLRIYGLTPDSVFFPINLIPVKYDCYFVGHNINDLRYELSQWMKQNKY